MSRVKAKDVFSVKLPEEHLRTLEDAARNECKENAPYLKVIISIALQVNDQLRAQLSREAAEEHKK